MKCIFEINSRVALSEPAELKHDKIIKSLKAVLPPWGLSKDLNILFPGFGESSVALLQLSKFL